MKCPFKVSFEELKMLEQGYPPNEVYSGWDCAKVIEGLATNLLILLEGIDSWRLDDDLFKEDK